MSDLRRRETMKISIDSDLEDLIPGFLENRQQDIQKLQAAMAAGDFETIRTLGHRMRGDGGGYGFHMISEIGQAIETAAQDKDTAEIVTRIDALTAYLERIEVVYE
jgi:HPt (histidine-containing phosphotransfer) domain-containing protein